MKAQKITVEVAIRADIQKVWDYWTKPEHIINWNSASEGWHCPKAENNLAVGQSFRYTMASKNGQMSFDFGGVYDEVTPLKKIVFTMEDGRQVLTVFEKESGAVKVTETFDTENENPIEMQQAGWQAILNNFKKYVEVN